MGYGIKLNHTNEEIAHIINKAAIKKLTGKFYSFKNISRIRDIVGIFVKEAIIQTETWKSLSSDSERGLNAHLGLPQGEKTNMLNSILDIWVKEIEVRPRKIEFTKNGFRMGYDFYAINGNFAEVLSSPNAIVENYSGRSAKGITSKYIPWLHWLLIAGDQVQIDNYHIKFREFPLNRSRSGKAIMVLNGHYVLPSFFGPYGKDNNFVCRAMAEVATNKEFRQNLTDILTSKTSLVDATISLNT